MAQSLDQTAAFNIASQPLDAALLEFSRQTGVQVVAASNVVAGKTAPSVRLTGPAREALAALLKPSRLSFVTTGANTVGIVPLAETRPPRVPTAPRIVRRPVGPMRSAVAETPLTTTIDELVVTGSLVRRDGFEAPTPVTVLQVASLQRAAPANIPDGLNQLPQFVGSRNQAQNGQSVATTPQAGNYLNLRNLGFVRSLILFDGQRVTATSYEGTVDTNIIPQALVQRVEVVTAGAGAAYGSDAVTGVVNFVLDKSFTGVRATAQAGVSELGDARSSRLGFAFGAPVAQDRGHVLFSLEHYQSDGVKTKEHRDLFNRYPIAYGNGGSAPYRTEFDARYANTSFGGLILSGPLAGYHFNPDSTITLQDRGRLPVINNIQIGGDGGYTGGGALVSALRTDQVFGRFAYELNDNVTAHVQATLSEARNRWVHNSRDNRFGNITIFSGNAFLRPEVQAALGSTASFTLGRQGLEQGGKYIDMLTDAFSVSAGVSGQVGEGWDWRLYYGHGESRLRATHQRNGENVRLYAAIDAVRDPTTGAIVCRVSLTNPGLYPGCTPFNILGQGAASREAIEYVFGANSQYRAVTTLDDLSFNLAGEAFTLPAGPVSVAMGMEHRRQALKLTSNASPSAPLVTTGVRAFPSGLGRFGNTNVGVADGSHVVDEAYGEVVMPLVRDLPGLQMLEFNGALRVTNYSASGRVETYKAGFNYVATDSLRLRATLSRDIRAPTLFEQFAGASLNTQPLTDSHTGVSSSITTVTQGEPDLTPEIGRTRTVGVIWHPVWLPGFDGSIDYYDIEIKDAIGVTSALELNEECEASGGAAPACAFIQRPFPFSNRTAANMVQRIQISPVNLAQVYTHGFDIEAGYRFATDGFGAGDGGFVDLRLLANYVPTRKIRQSPDSPPRQDGGVGGVANSGLSANPKWRSLFSIRYDQGPWSVNLQERYIGRMVRSNQPDVTFVDNVLEPVWYTDLDLRRDFEIDGRQLTAFVTINNLLNRDPPLVPTTREPGLIFPSLQTIYDVIGRYYTAGLQLRF